MPSPAVKELARRHWRAEVASLLREAPELTPTARAAVTAVLRSLEHDPTSDAETLVDVRLLLGEIAGSAGRTENHSTREIFVRIGQRLATELAA